jgi:EAL domain-containing protein (putative c-di-GMP-specific phosphodiesterase class I)
MRWRNADLGVVSPGEFIPIAEGGRLILDLGAWALTRACEVARELDERGRPSTVAVNVTGRELREPGFTGHIRSVLERTRLAPAQLQLEITEGSLIEAVDDAVRIMHELDALGVGLAIDDFGTGFSSFAYLRHMPVRTLKIDRSFVHEIAVSGTDALIVASIVRLAHALGMTVVAEGVETATQLSVLRDCGCDQGQGFVFSGPVTAAELPEMLERTFER